MSFSEKLHDFLSQSKPPPPSKELSRVTISDLDANVVALVAQYNPKELSVDKATTWNKSPNARGNQPELVYGSSTARSMSLELFFDTYERGADVHELYVAPLIRLMDVIDPDSRSEDEKRPPRLQLVWGSMLPPFICVLESVQTKYTMFLPDGMPVRATCNVKLMAATREPWRR